MNENQLLQEQREAIRAIVSKYFKNSKGEPYNLTDGQCDIFHAVTDKRIKWVWVSAPTRYGKTEVIALAYIYLAAICHVKIPVVGGSAEKAEKIMEYIVQHLSDHPELYAGLINLALDDIEKLKLTISKTALRWSTGGWIFVTSIESRSISKEAEGVVGEGGDVVGLEEAGLIKQDDQYSKIVRMPEEDRGWGKLIQSGNCIEGSIFEKAFNNPLFYKVRISLEQAISEGRYTRDRLENQVKPQTTSKDWKRYWLVEFPGKNEFTYFKPHRYNVLPSIDDLIVFGALDPSLGDEGKEVKAVNPQGSKIGIVVLGRHKETFQKYELESIIEHMTITEAIRRIFNMPYKFRRFAIEEIAFQRYLLSETKKKSAEFGFNIPFMGLKQSKNKLERIESMEPALNTGRILFKGDNQLWDDMAAYPRLKFLDGLDSLEMAHRISEIEKPNFAV